MVGHKSMQMIDRVYSHIEPADVYEEFARSERGWQLLLRRRLESAVDRTLVFNQLVRGLYGLTENLESESND